MSSVRSSGPAPAAIALPSHRWRTASCADQSAHRVGAAQSSGPNPFRTATNRRRWSPNTSSRCSGSKLHAPAVRSSTVLGRIFSGSGLGSIIGPPRFSPWAAAGALRLGLLRPGSRGRVGVAPWEATCFCGGGPRNFGGVRSAPVAAVDGRQALLERDAALGRIDERLRDAIAGSGSLLMVEGPAGIGKTRLVLAAGRHGRELGLTTLSARGSELERDFAYGLVRQLFEAPLVAASPPEQAELLAGAAGRAAALFGVAAPQDDVADALLDPSFAILHGLYWLSANLGRRSPLLLCIDDAHWADQASLRFLHYLGRRLEELPIAVVAAARPAESAEGSPLLAALAADPSAEVFALAPLSEQAVAELVRLGLGAEVDPAFARACHAATGGVPFLVQELVRAIAEQGIKPTAAACSRVAALTPRAVSHSVVLRLRRISAAARQLARATAVLGEADLRLAARLADADPGAAGAADELAAAGILEEGRPLRFVHPIVRAAVEADLSPGARAGLHAAAARRLADDGTSAHRI